MELKPEFSFPASSFSSVHLTSWLSSPVAMGYSSSSRVEVSRLAILSSTAKGHDSWYQSKGAADVFRQTQAHFRGDWSDEVEMVTQMELTAETVTQISGSRAFGIKEGVLEPPLPLLTPCKGMRGCKDWGGTTLPHPEQPMVAASQVFDGMSLKFESSLQRQMEETAAAVRNMCANRGIRDVGEGSMHQMFNGMPREVTVWGDQEGKECDTSPWLLQSLVARSALEVFDKIPLKDVVWDEETPHDLDLDLYDGILQQVAQCGEHLDGGNRKSIVEPFIDDVLTQTTNELDVRNDGSQHLAWCDECLDDQEEEPFAKEVTGDVLTYVGGLSLFLELGTGDAIQTFINTSEEDLVNVVASPSLKAHDKCQQLGGGKNPGQFKLYSGGLAWKKQGGGGKTIEVDKADITSVTWMRIPRSYQLGVGTKEGLFYRFIGFREQDVSNLTNFIQKSTGISPEEKQLSVSGHNWGGIEINGNMLSFNVGTEEAFEVSLADVSQTQMQGKTDVVLEFHVDDTTGANVKDSLMDLSFHVPTSNTLFVGDEHRAPAQILWQTILNKADVGSSEEAVVTFDGIAILTPRGRYSVELHLSFLRLQGQANDFKIQYSSILRLFVLPKSNNPHTFVVITLDPPIRKGQTLYPHIVIQFETEAVVERDLTLSEEVLAEKYKDRLEGSYNGLIHEVFSKILRGLSGAKVTRPSTFRSCLDGYAVKSSLKAEDGLLYPLEKGFFFLPKPPTLILHEEIEYVEFERHGAGGASISSQYFDLLVKLKNDQEHLFRNIQRNEYHNLFNFIGGKHLKILNLGDGQGRTGGVTAVLQSTDDDSVDPHLERIKNQTGDEESDEEDEDFVADKDDSGSPTDDSEEEGSDASLSGGEKEKYSKKEASNSKAPAKRKQKSGDVEGSEKRKAKKKKDPNAPKRAIAPFMYFSKAERINLKNSNPELATTEIAKKLGERWQKMTAEEKQPYVEQSQVDKKRYAEETAAYRGAAPVDVDSGDGSD